MPAVRASIERVTLRRLERDAQGHPERSLRMTDGELVELVRAGDTTAFGELVERHRGAVYRAALAALGNEADAEDVAQESLVLAYGRLDQFRGDASIRTWMVSIAWRLSLTRRRRLWWKAGRTASPESERYALRDATPSPEARMQSAEFIRIVQRESRGLPPKLRDALLLAAAGDLTQDEIAVALNIPPSTFRGRVRDARLRLKERLGRE